MQNDIFSILNDCSTEKFNLEAPVQGLGYVRKFRDCFIIDKEGNLKDIYTVEGLHINDLGYFKVTKVLENYIEK